MSEPSSDRPDPCGAVNLGHGGSSARSSPIGRTTTEPDPADRGGETACWAHLVDEFDAADGW